MTAVGDDELAHDREPEPEVLLRTTPRARTGGLPETVERTRAVDLGHPRSFVGDAQLDP